MLEDENMIIHVQSIFYKNPKDLKEYVRCGVSLDRDHAFDIAMSLSPSRTLNLELEITGAVYETVKLPDEYLEILNNLDCLVGLNTVNTDYCATIFLSNGQENDEEIPCREKTEKTFKEAQQIIKDLVMKYCFVTATEEPSYIGLVVS